MLSPPEGEDVLEAADRIFKAVAKIVRRSRGDEVVIVLHDFGTAMLRCWIADRPLTSMRNMDDGPIVEQIVLPLAMVDAMEKAAEGIVPAA
ncbi:MAG: histidine phosphatase family protein [Anaerolineae bacterium]|nr:histidine phosphatase family protein [Phycisphaerae bacterium]